MAIGLPGHGQGSRGPGFPGLQGADDPEGGVRRAHLGPGGEPPAVPRGVQGQLALQHEAVVGRRSPRLPELTKAVYRYIMAMARFNLACSARFNDVQHTSPQTVKSTSNTLELLAWQTKTTSAVAIKRNPVPLIAPLFSFSGARWWSGGGRDSGPRRSSARWTT